MHSSKSFVWQECVQQCCPHTTTRNGSSVVATRAAVIPAATPLAVPLATPVQPHPVRLKPRLEHALEVCVRLMQRLVPRLVQRLSAWAGVRPVSRLHQHEIVQGPPAGGSVNTMQTPCRHHAVQTPCRHHAVQTPCRHHAELCPAVDLTLLFRLSQVA